MQLQVPVRSRRRWRPCRIQRGEYLLPQEPPGHGATPAGTASSAVHRAVAEAVRECEERLEVRHAEEMEALQQDFAALAAHMQV